mmetsp:Transcript_49226/g.73224  ORF Transcript_49226/g.73224 Transcript_49226/m.73224 type:complete len:82 (-) Transcript_49226:77-322(-)
MHVPDSAILARSSETCRLAFSTMPHLTPSHRPAKSLDVDGFTAGGVATDGEDGIEDSHDTVVRLANVKHDANTRRKGDMMG